jgi:hypothetical protein
MSWHECPVDYVENNPSVMVKHYQNESMTRERNNNMTGSISSRWSVLFMALCPMSPHVIVVFHCSTALAA